MIEKVGNESLHTFLLRNGVEEGSEFYICIFDFIKKAKEEEREKNIGKQFLRFELKPSGNEYIILNKKNQPLGDIYKKRGKWLFSPDLGIFDRDLWFADGCLFQIAYFIQKLKQEE